MAQVARQVPVDLQAALRAVMVPVDRQAAGTAAMVQVGLRAHPVHMAAVGHQAELWSTTALRLSTVRLLRHRQAM